MSILGIFGFAYSRPGGVIDYAATFTPAGDAVYDAVTSPSGGSPPPFPPPIVPPPAGGGGSGSGVRGTTVATPVPVVAPPRSYPHVNQVTDVAAQQSLKLLWDRHYALEEAHTATRSVVTAQATAITSLGTQVQQASDDAQAGLIAASKPTSSGLGGAPVGGPGGDPGTDGGDGEAGCSSAGSTGHVPAGSPLTALTAGKVCCGTGNEFPSLLAIVANQGIRDANRSTLLGRMIWHLNQAGFTNVARYGGSNPFALLIDIAGKQNAYRVTDYATFDVAMRTTMVFGGMTDTTTPPDGGIPD